MIEDKAFYEKRVKFYTNGRIHLLHCTALLPQFTAPQGYTRVISYNE